MKKRNIFSMLSVLLLFCVFALAPQLHAQDTTFFGSTGHDVGVSKTVSFTKDSTKATVTNWIDFTSFENRYVYLTHTLTDTDYGRSAGNDTSRCIIQGKDANGNISNIDTVGTGSAGSEIIVSSGVTAQYLITQNKHFPFIRLYYEAVRTYSAKNGRYHYVGSLYTTPK
jgi:hypothetical protein